MTLFSYTASNSAGEQVEGTLEAHDTAAVRTLLANMNLHVHSVQEAPKQTHEVRQPIWNTTDDFDKHVAEATAAKDDDVTRVTYFPILNTLRLYAGWLLAWYLLVYAIGFYSGSRNLPFRVPYVESLYLSPLVLSFTLAAFLFLLCTSLYRYLGKGKKLGWALALVGILLFAWYRANVV